MKIRNILALILGVGILSAGLGFGVSYLQRPAPPAPVADNTPAPLDRMPVFQYPDLAGVERRSGEWQGQVVVVNFWASWCPPCRAETPLFVELQEAHGDDGLQFVGIAIDDREPVQDFADSFGVNYPLLLGGLDAVALSKRLGNRYEGLPFTAVFDREGRLRLQKGGEVTRAELEPLLKELL